MRSEYFTIYLNNTRWKKNSFTYCYGYKKKKKKCLNFKTLIVRVLHQSIVIVKQYFLYPIATFRKSIRISFLKYQMFMSLHIYLQCNDNRVQQSTIKIRSGFKICKLISSQLVYIDYF